MQYYTVVMTLRDLSKLTLSRGNSAYCGEHFLGLNEIIHIRALAQCLAHTQNYNCNNCNMTCTH